MILKIRNLNERELEALDQSRKLAMRLMNVSSDYTTHDFNRAYFDVLENTPDNLQFQNALGVAFGDLILSGKDYHWLRTEDNYGEETAVGMHEHKIVCHPITMIQKRLSAKVTVNSGELVASTIRAMEDMRASGEYQSN